MRMGTWAAAGGAALVVMFALAGCGGDKPPRPSPAELDEKLVGVYCDLVAAERAGEAYDRCLARSYREEVAREAFIAAHAKRRREVGAVQGRKVIHTQETSNLFDGERRTYLRYEVAYPAGPQYLDVVLTDADGEFKIEGTYRQNAGETLDFVLW
jgi:hypothetical protein